MKKDGQEKKIVAAPGGPLRSIYLKWIDYPGLVDEAVKVLGHLRKSEVINPPVSSSCVDQVCQTMVEIGHRNSSDITNAFDYILRNTSNRAYITFRSLFLNNRQRLSDAIIQMRTQSGNQNIIKSKDRAKYELEANEIKAALALRLEKRISQLTKEDYGRLNPGTRAKLVAALKEIKK